MDLMLSYCGQQNGDSVEYTNDNEQLNDETESSSFQREFQIESNHNDGYQELLDRDLFKQCDNYRSQIKRQEEEISSYQQNMELMEEDYLRVSKMLSVAEKSIRKYEKKLESYEETIDSLKSELDSYYNFENTTKQSQQSSFQKLSFSDEINLKNYSTELDDTVSTIGDNNQVKDEQLVNEDKLKLFQSFQLICNKNIVLKNENEILLDKIHQLEKDNEDFQTLLWNSKNEFSKKSSKKFAISTPVKNLNFISYKALNLTSNNSFSIDEDYESENIAFDKNFKRNNNCIGQETTNLNEVSCFSQLSKINEHTSIENEVIPSCIVQEDTIYEDKSVFRKNKLSLFSQSIDINNIVSIEDENIPQVELPDSSKSLTREDLVAGNNSNDNNYVSESDSKEDNGQESTITNPNKFDVSVPPKNYLNLDNFGNHQLILLFFLNLIKQFKMSNHKKIIGFLIYNLRYHKLLYLLFSFASFYILNFAKCYLNLQTRLIPFYSIQEILNDILHQFCIKRI